jgi:hypothetical protein
MICRRETLEAMMLMIVQSIRPVKSHQSSAKSPHNCTRLTPPQVSPSLRRMLYSSSPNSARPCFEFKYSFLSNPVSLLSQPYLLHPSRLHSRDVPLNSPLHCRIRSDKRRDDKQNLVPAPPQHVPEALGDECGHGALSVRGKRVGRNTFARAAAAFVGVTP